MNLCFLSMDYPSHASGGGVGNQVRTLAGGLAQAGHDVSVVALAGSDLPTQGKENGIRIHRVSNGNLHWYVHRLPAVGSGLTLALRELEYSHAVYSEARILHRQMPIDVFEGTETGALWVALGLKEVPLVIRLHGEHYTFRKYTPDLRLTLGIRFSRVLQRAALRRASMLISPSVAHAAEIRNELGVDCPPIEIIPNCVDLGLIPQPDDQTQRKATVLFAGRLERLKGIPLLLEAANLIRHRFPKVRFVLAGGHHPTLNRQEIDTLLRRYSLCEHVQLLGHVPWEQLACWYQQSAVCVLPSYYETFGVAALESMAFGVPVVATAVGGLPEVVEDGVTGVLVPPGDVQSLANAITELLEAPERRRRMGEAGRDRAVGLFSVERARKDTLQLYERILKESSRPAHRIGSASRNG